MISEKEPAKTGGFYPYEFGVVLLSGQRIYSYYQLVQPVSGCVKTAETKQELPRKGVKMPVNINNKTFYRTSEVCQIACISRSTLLRWLRQADLDISNYRDRRSWRLFTADDVDKLTREANRICRAQTAPANNRINIKTLNKS